MGIARKAFWGSIALLFHTHVGYPLSLAALARMRGEVGEQADPPAGVEPAVSLIVAAHDEADVIEAKLANALALEWPRERLELIVACDGCTDHTAELARATGADRVLELPRAGKLAAQNAAVVAATGEILAFSDANSEWEPAALRELLAPFSAPEVGYVCGQVRFADPDGDNEEGAYWRYEMWIRELESGLGGVTAGNGAIYAVRRGAYLFLDPSRSHDLSFPFELRRDGWRSLYAPRARASERMVPTLEGEFERKRRMMRGLWDIVARDRMWDPRGLGPLFAYQVLSHRVIRYLSPLLHGVALIASAVLAPRARIYGLALAVQAAVLGAAACAVAIPARPLRLARYYVLVTASIAAGALDRWRKGPPAAWERSEGTR